MEPELALCLEQCGLSKEQVNTVAEEGYLMLTNFSLNQYADIKSFAKKLQALPVDRGVSNLVTCM